MWIFGYGSLLWRTNFPYEEKRHGYITHYVRRFWQASLDHRGTLDHPGRVVTLIYTGQEKDKVWGTAYRILPEHYEAVIEYLDLREQNGYDKRRIMFHPVSMAICDNQNSLDTLSTNIKQLVQHKNSPERLSCSSNTNNNNNQTAEQHTFVVGEGLLEEQNDSEIDEVWESESEKGHVPTNIPMETNHPSTILPDKRNSNIFDLDCVDVQPFLVEAYIAEETNEHYLGPAPTEHIARQIKLSRGISGTNLEYLINLWKTLKVITPPGIKFDPDDHLTELIRCISRLKFGANTSNINENYNNLGNISPTTARAVMQEILSLETKEFVLQSQVSSRNLSTESQSAIIDNDKKKTSTEEMEQNDIDKNNATPNNHTNQPQKQPINNDNVLTKKVHNPDLDSTKDINNNIHKNPYIEDYNYSPDKKFSPLHLNYVNDNTTSPTTINANDLVQQNQTHTHQCPLNLSSNTPSVVVDINTSHVIFSTLPHQKVN